MANSIKSLSSAESVSSSASDNNNGVVKASKSQRRRQRRNEQKKRAADAAVAAAKVEAAKAEAKAKAEADEKAAMALYTAYAVVAAEEKAAAEKAAQKAAKAARKEEAAVVAAAAPSPTSMAPQPTQSPKAVAPPSTASSANASQPATPLPGLSASRWAIQGQAVDSSAAKPTTPGPKAQASKGASHGDDDKALTATPTGDGTPMSKNQRRKANKLAKMAEDQARTDAAVARAGAEARRVAATVQTAIPAAVSGAKGTDGPASVIPVPAVAVAGVAKPIAPTNSGKASTSVPSFSGKGEGMAVPFTFDFPTSKATTKPASGEKQEKMAPVGDVSPEDSARDIEDLQKEVSEQGNIIRSRNATIREMDKQTDELRAQLKKMEDERHDQGRSLESTVSQLKSVRQERSGLADELNHLQAEKRETSENLDKARKEADNAVESKLRLQAQLEEAQIEIGRLHQFELAISESSENLEVLNANFEALQLELQARDEELLVLRQEHHDEVSSRDDEDSMGQSTSVSRLDSELFDEPWDNLEDNIQGPLTFSPVVQLVNSPPSPFSLIAPAVPLPLPATKPTFLKQDSPEPQVPMQQATAEPEEKPAPVKQEDAELDGKNIQQEPEERAQHTEEIDLPCRWPAAELAGEAQKVSPNTHEVREPKSCPWWRVWLHMVLMWVFGPFVAPIRKLIIGKVCPSEDEAPRVGLDLAILASLFCLAASAFSVYSNLQERSLWLAANEQTRQLAVHYQRLA